MIRTKIAVSALVLAAASIALADPIPKATCLPKGTWQCIEQGTRVCNWNKTTCEGQCTVCVGNTTVPEHMCFMHETDECPPAAPYVCGVRFDNASCVKVDGNCICKTAIIPPMSDGECTFSSCNPS